MKKRIKNGKENKYISIEEFAKMSDKKVSTIKRRYKEIPFIDKENNYRVLEGTRYPYKCRKKYKDDYSRRRILLVAISKRQYIDYNKLGVYKATFEKFLKDYVDEGLIEKNGLGNVYGANEYDCTTKGSKIASMQYRQCIKEISLLFSQTAGTLMGAFVSQIQEK